jgi:uncharacterized protein (TIGR03492 family)
LPSRAEPQVLLVSNGSAEDLFGAAVLSRLAARLQLRAWALPLVGSGSAYQGLATLLGPRVTMPSAGFLLNSWANLIADLRSGFLAMSVRQWRCALTQRGRADLVVVSGDAYALAVGALAAVGTGKTKLVHLQPLVSVQYAEGLSPLQLLRRPVDLGSSHFLPWETALQRRADAVYVRDAPSALVLRRIGVPARYYGSFAMDILPAQGTGELSAGLGAKPVLALLPGSRADAAWSLPRMLEAVCGLPELQAVVAWARPPAELRAPPSWELRSHPGGAWLRGPAEVLVEFGNFHAVLRAADLVLATAGTATEQAAGLGRPAVGFPTPGPQYTASFAARQARLLGGALQLVAPEPGAIRAALRALLCRPGHYARASVQGLRRIGPAGALSQIAADLAELLGSPAAPYPP